MERFRGYRQALADAAIPLDSQLVVYGDNSPEGAAETMARLLELSKPPTAVFCYNDMLALGAMHAAHGRRRIPDDISFVGFDDLFFTEFLQPPLTTIRQPKREMGRLAMGTVLQLLAGDRPEKTTHVKGQLIVRGSTAPPPQRTRPIEPRGRVQVRARLVAPEERE